MENQKCSVCQIEKPLQQFHKNKNRKNGVSVTCKKCAISRSRKWEIDNPDKVRENSRKLYHKDIEKSRINRKTRVRKWQKNNPDKVRAATRDYFIRHPEVKRLHEQKRRAQKNNNGVFTILEKDIVKLIKESCVKCGSKQNITMDHIVPLSRGGVHSIGNLQPLCRSCNASKGSKTMMEWRKVI